MILSAGTRDRYLAGIRICTYLYLVLLKLVNLVSWAWILTLEATSRGANDREFNSKRGDPHIVARILVA